MGVDTQQLAWGVGFSAMMYVVGNGVWTNHLARRRAWVGWLMWLVAGVLVIIAGSFIDIRLSGSESSVWHHLNSVDMQNHAIALILFALMSVPGAASVLMKQPSKWTRLSLILPAIVVFIPVGMLLGSGASSVMEGLGLAFVIAALTTGWQIMLDTPPPEQQRKAG